MTRPTLSAADLAAYADAGYTHIYRSEGGQLMGVKLINGKPVWHVIKEKRHD